MKESVKPIEQEPIVFNYRNYRDYLKDYFHYKKNRLSTFSFNTMARKLGMSKTQVREIIMEQRKLVPSKIVSFSRYLELSPNEESHFRVLINYNQAGSAELKKFYSSQLQLKG